MKPLSELYISKTISSKFDLDSWCKGLGPFLNLWKKLNQGHDLVKIQLSKVEYTDEKSPISIFLDEEFRFMIDLIQKIHKCFSALNRVCKKVAAANDVDLDTGNSLLNYKVSR